MTKNILNTSAGENERREYFRIEDQVILDYRLIREDELAGIMRQLDDMLPNKFMTSSSFAGSTRSMNRLLNSISNYNSDLAHYLKGLDEKLNHLSKLFIAEDMRIDGRIPDSVSLSAGGVCLYVDKPFLAGSLLEMKLVLLPSLLGILIVGRVSYCNKLEGFYTNNQYELAVEYEYIREPDRDLLVRHVMNKETQALRKRRKEEREREKAELEAQSTQESLGDSGSMQENLEDSAPVQDDIEDIE